MKFIYKDKNLSVINYSSFFNKLKGLMFKKEPIKDAYLFKRCRSIHTFFMKQNIDVIITDKDYKILLVKENVSKNKIIACKKGFYTFELPIGTAKNIKINTKIKIED